MLKKQHKENCTYSHVCIIHVHALPVSAVIIGRQWYPLGEGSDKLFVCLLQNVSHVPFRIDVKTPALLEESHSV